MEVRPIGPEEDQEILRLKAVCFAQSSEHELSGNYAEELKDAYGLFDAGKLRSAMISHDYRMYYDGRSIPMAGIGSVATYPEYRRKGHVRELFSVLFPRMRELGQAFSVLFPFSFPYYRSFGYELAYSRNHYTLPLTQLRPIKDEGALELIQPSNGHLREIQEIRSLYQSIAAPRNLSLDRSDADWKRLIPSEPHKSQEYFYLYRDATGQARAYFRYKVLRKTPYAIEMSIQDLGWSGHGDLQRLLSQLALFNPPAVSATLCLPSDCLLELHIPEPYSIEHKIMPSCMVKVVDVQAALALTKFPGAGTLVMSVQDDTLDWNKKKLLVEWSAGVTTVAPTTRKPELSLDIRTLGQLLIGYIGGLELLDHGLAESELDAQQLASIFPHKALYQNDHF